MRFLVRVLIAGIIIAGLYFIAGHFFPPVRHTIELIRLWQDTMPAILPVPVQGVPRRGLVDTWGGARSGGRKHEGIDIFAVRNTPVLSSTRGIVLKVGINELGGNIVTVYGPGGYAHYYAHLEKYGKYEEGDLVNPGDTLGYVGTSGNARGTPPHLHYGIYQPSGGAINPYPYLTPTGER